MDGRGPPETEVLAKSGFPSKVDGKEGLFYFWTFCSLQRLSAKSIFDRFKRWDKTSVVHNFQLPLCDVSEFILITRL